MESYEPPFQWVQFAQGRARFSGGVRGADELGHETFAVAIDGGEYFGEIDRIFLPNNNDYNIEVISFGYASDDVGVPVLDGCRAFGEAQIATVQALVTPLIAAGARMSDPPHVLMQYPTARYMGEVVFRDGWAMVLHDEVVS